MNKKDIIDFLLKEQLKYDLKRAYKQATKIEKEIHNFKVKLLNDLKALNESQER